MYETTTFLKPISNENYYYYSKRYIELMVQMPVVSGNMASPLGVCYKTERSGKGKEMR